MAQVNLDSVVVKNELKTAHWFAWNVIADEVYYHTPLPAHLRSAIAHIMVTDPNLGWPDKDSAMATLDEWKWE